MSRRIILKQNGDLIEVLRCKDKFSNQYVVKSETNLGKATDSEKRVIKKYSRKTNILYLNDKVLATLEYCALAGMDALDVYYKFMRVYPMELRHFGVYEINTLMNILSKSYNRYIEKLRKSQL